MRTGGGLRERMFVRKRFRSKRTFQLKVRGQARVSKYRKDTGELIEHTPWVKNTIEAGGFDKFLRALKNDFTGHGTLNSVDASVAIATTAPPSAYVFTQVGTSAGPTSGATTKGAPTQATLWQWNDDSVNTYINADWLHFWYQDPNGGVGDEYRVAYVNIAAGTKPPDENWHYQFFLELYSTDTDFDAAGLAILLDLYNGNQTVYLTTTGIRLLPTVGAGSGADVGVALTPDANPVVDIAANTITWIWTVADGTSNGTWGGTKIKIGTGLTTNLRWGGCKTDGSSCGTKAAGEEWEYTYEITISQGA